MFKDYKRKHFEDKEFGEKFIIPCTCRFRDDSGLSPSSNLSPTLVRLVCEEVGSRPRESNLSPRSLRPSAPTETPSTDIFTIKIKDRASINFTNPGVCLDRRSFGLYCHLQRQFE